MNLIGQTPIESTLVQDLAWLTSMDAIHRPISEEMKPCDTNLSTTLNIRPVEFEICISFAFDTVVQRPNEQCLDLYDSIGSICIRKLYAVRP